MLFQNKMEKILSGKPVAQAIYQEIKEKVSLFYDKGIIPRFVVFKVGDDPASDYYVQSIRKKAKKTGILVDVLSYDPQTSQAELIQGIQKANCDSSIHGIMLQLPLLEHLDQREVVLQINPLKDIDGLHPINAGKLILGQDCFVPCTPSAVMELLHYYRIPIEGARVVIIGRSAIVGLPLFNLLVQKKNGANATVTMCHSRSKDIPEISREADILICAIGKPNYIDHTYVNGKSVVIDVGINELYDEEKKASTFVGDVYYQDVSPVVRAITPVPGGIGTITTASLLKNVVLAIGKQQSKR